MKNSTDKETSGRGNLYNQVQCNNSLEWLKLKQQELSAHLATNSCPRVSDSRGGEFSKDSTEKESPRRRSLLERVPCNMRFKWFSTGASLKRQEESEHPEVGADVERNCDCGDE